MANLVVCDICKSEAKYSIGETVDGDGIMVSLELKDFSRHICSSADCLLRSCSIVDDRIDFVWPAMASRA